MNAKHYRSEAMESVHETMEAMYRHGFIPERTMRHFDAACLVPAESSGVLSERFQKPCLGMGEGSQKANRISLAAALAHQIQGPGTILSVKKQEAGFPASCFSKDEKYMSRATPSTRFRNRVYAVAAASARSTRNVERFFPAFFAARSIMASA